MGASFRKNKVKTIKGNLITLAKEGEFDVIAHGCNCFCTMGSGIAKQIKQVFPQAYSVDLKTIKGDKKKLGTCSCCDIIPLNLTVVNAYTQYDFGGKKVNVNYKAVCRCMDWIANNFKDKRIGLPKIGAGLAGGDWSIIQQIIEEKMFECDVTIVEYVF